MTPEPLFLCKVNTVYDTIFFGVPPFANLSNITLTNENELFSELNYQSLPHYLNFQIQISTLSLSSICKLTDFHFKCSLMGHLLILVDAFSRQTMHIKSGLKRGDQAHRNYQAPETKHGAPITRSSSSKSLLFFVWIRVRRSVTLSRFYNRSMVKMHFQTYSHP